jgi:hypothetical protein
MEKFGKDACGFPVGDFAGPDYFQQNPTPRGLIPHPTNGFFPSTNIA